jgi:divalent metal cation (Fe/Co/Zn/Cd) transporter
MRATVRDRYVLFALGAATGSAVGLIVGALISFWLGEEAVDGLKRAFRRLLGRDRHPNFELFLQ